MPLATAETGQKPVCIASYRIDHTHITDDRTIMFHMNDGTVWRNDLIDKCPGLKIEGGFSYEATDPGSDEICDNLVTIRVLHQGNTCLLGAFTQVPKAAKSTVPVESQ